MSTEQWEPGKVEISKITKNFTYRALFGLSPPPPDDSEPPPTSNCHDNRVDCYVAAESSRPLNKVLRRWARRLTRWKERKKKRKEEDALLDSAATSTFVQSEQGLTITGKSHKVVVAADGGFMPASSTGLLDLNKLRPGAREAIVVPGLKTKALMSVSPLANNGYTTIFHPRYCI